MASKTKKAIYAEYGIDYKDGKILSPMGTWIQPLLCDGNSKVGTGVWTWSMLPGNVEYVVNIDGVGEVTIKGTCACNCEGCYAQTGFYKTPSCKKALALRTYIARNHLDFMVRAIIAQVKADKIRLFRIHASGDFFSLGYINAWRFIVSACPDTSFWTYTKFESAVNAFDDIANCNIVKSIIKGHGYNFGHCDYILALYEILKSAGVNVYICKCGFDPNQHCVNCKGCIEHDVVLFLEHSTSYKAEIDPLYPTLKALVMAQ